MIICVSGLFYAITAALEQIVRALKKKPGITVVTVGPYFGVEMPYLAGMRVAEKYAFEPDVKLPYSQEVPIAFVEKILSTMNIYPDIWFDVNAGFWLGGRPSKGRRITFLTDPHVLMEYYRRIYKDYDYIFNPQTQYRLNVENEHYLPYATDAEWYRKMENPEKIYDVSLIGNLYPQRTEFFRILSQRRKTYFGLGLSKEDAGERYNQSKIGMNWSSMLDLTARVFEIGLTGVIPLFNRVPDMNRFFEEDRDYVGFGDINEALEKTEYVLNNYEKYKILGDNIHKKVAENHTWDVRINQIFEIMKI